MEQHPSIRGLPLELLLTIFQWSLDITTLQKDRCRLSLVCRHWRDIVQKSACLWTDISGHDSISYIELSLVKSADLPIDLHYLLGNPYDGRPPLRSYLNAVRKHFSRCCSISLATETRFASMFSELFDGLQATPASRLEILVVKAGRSQRLGRRLTFSLPKLPGMTAFPKLRRLEIDGVPCEIPPLSLQLNNVRSLNLVDVANVEADQLLDVLRNSPRLEWLGLGRSPVACPSQPALAPIHLPYLLALHLIFMPISVSHFLLSTIRAPNCSQLVMSSEFPEFPDDVVRANLFTSETKHFSPVLQKLLTRGIYKDVHIMDISHESADFLLQFHDEEDYKSVNWGILDLEFRLESVGQVMETVDWLAGYMERDMPKIPIRLFMDGIGEARLLDVMDLHMAITHLAFRPPRAPFGAPRPSPIFVRMAQPTGSGWALPDLEGFTYDPEDSSETRDEEMLDMLRSRYGSSPDDSNSDRVLPRPLRKLRLGTFLTDELHLLGEAEKILPQAEVFQMETYDDSMW
ncbi:hypothetical protein FRC00_004391 [Tulasnella sp. 408]|nr:hypothetical protein FRC00_004391 [Tulasnella sp. 408]